jgi:hypothetical protein
MCHMKLVHMSLNKHDCHMKLVHMLLNKHDSHMHQARGRDRVDLPIIMATSLTTHTLVPFFFRVVSVRQCFKTSDMIV